MILSLSSGCTTSESFLPINSSCKNENTIHGLVEIAAGCQGYSWSILGLDVALEGQQ